MSSVLSVLQFEKLLRPLLLKLQKTGYLHVRVSGIIWVNSEHLHSPQNDEFLQQKTASETSKAYP